MARVAGPDAASFLHGLVTNDIEGLAVGDIRYAALLTPQGKILFDFLVFRLGQDEFQLDAPADKTADLVKRLGFYKLRAKVDIADVSQDFAVVAGGSGAPADPRDPALGGRGIVARADIPGEDGAARAAYDARRIALGVPQGGLDFPYGDAFPHDANMDLVNGVDFSKGCYVGQEVVSRMKHRAALRKRVVRVAFDGPAPAPGAAIVDGELPVGVMGASVGAQGLAMVRLDRVADAAEAGRPLTVAGVRVSVLG